MSTETQIPSLETLPKNKWLMDRIKNSDVLQDACLIRGLRSDGYSAGFIAENCGCSVYMVNKYIADMTVPTSRLITVNSKISDEKIEIIKNMRFRGDTLGSIAKMVGVSSMTVYNYTKGIANERRKNRIALLNTRTGNVSGFINA